MRFSKLYNGRTRTRRNIAILMWAVIAINFLDRTVLSVAAPTLQKQFSISPTEMGIIMSSFFWSYVVFLIPSGWLADKIGQRISLAISCTMWSIATAATALAKGATSLIFIRMLMGIGESGAYPSNAGVNAKWFPRHERAKVAGFFDSGNKIGSAIAMPVVVWLLTAFGWQTPFIVSGILGIVWVSIWLWYYNDPEKHKYINQNELSYIKAGQTVQSKEKQSPMRWYQLLRYRNVWALCIGFFALNYTSYFFITWFPSYLIEDRGMNIITMGFVAMIPPLAGIIGDLVGGWSSDRLLRKGYSLTTARKGNLVGGMLVATVIGLASFVHSPILCIALMSISSFGLQFAGCVVWTLPSDIAPNNMASVLAGLQGAVSNTAGIVGPIVTGIIITATHSFLWALILSSFITLIGALVYLFGLGNLETLKPSMESQHVDTPTGT
jgi:MFS transporter, ACS family, D-galactonate transporter